jgi:hypothetical protein
VEGVKKIDSGTVEMHSEKGKHNPERGGRVWMVQLKKQQYSDTTKYLSYNEIS